ncbi:DUF2065 domain-containing protein [Pseudodonghicola flavimaris]|uniref:DUF2065 domain-containing protein n=1 Tax=Pseudodonghicola flavimaris TaxID=3050036 RepID=A0ABT7EUY0_9RHOB|nr:DUF2065 domain-containing protein [Pseudodonghicola flavimaris]MDK3016113.1 DUF2065 domain-containing protein [Pseudodonghicola flavimaris]
MGFVILALGLVLIVEGLAWVLAPSLIERMLDLLRDLPQPARRQIGALAVISGLILLWIAARFGAVCPG